MIFDQLDLEIAEGERLALVGELGRAVQEHVAASSWRTSWDTPTSGAIYFGQDDICQRANELARWSSRNRELGFVWQIHSLLAEFFYGDRKCDDAIADPAGAVVERKRAVSLARLDEVGYTQPCDASDAERAFRGRTATVVWRAHWREITRCCSPTNQPAAWTYRTGDMIMGPD